MDGKACFFIGHRNVPDEVREPLLEVVELHITEYGVTHFTVGHYGQFDGLAAGAVKAAKKRHPEVTLYLLLPYHPYNRPIETPKGFDGTFYPPGMENVPKQYAIARANRYMVQNSDYLITYCKHWGNTRDLVEYAQRQEKKGLIQVTLL